MAPTKKKSVPRPPLLLKEKRLVIIGLPDSGAKLVGILLNSSPNVRCLRNRKTSLKVQRIDQDFSTLKAQIWEHDKKLRHRLADSDSLTLGLTFELGAFSVGLDLIKQPWHFRALIRDPVYTIASWRREENKHEPTGQPEHPIWDQFGVKFAGNELLEQQCEMWTYLSSVLHQWWGMDAIEVIRYEELFENPKKFLGGILDSLGEEHPEKWAKLTSQNKEKYYGPEDDVEGLTVSEVRVEVMRRCRTRKLFGYR